MAQYWNTIRRINRPFKMFTLASVGNNSAKSGSFYHDDVAGGFRKYSYIAKRERKKSVQNFECICIFSYSYSQSSWYSYTMIVLFSICISAQKLLLVYTRLSRRNKSQRPAGFIMTGSLAAHSTYHRWLHYDFIPDTREKFFFLDYSHQKFT